MMKFGNPSSLMVLSSSCSCLFSQNSSVLLTKSCACMCVYRRERETASESESDWESERKSVSERETASVCHCLCPQALHEHLSIPQYVRLEYENGQLFHHSTTMCTYGHKADGECQSWVERPRSGDKATKQMQIRNPDCILVAHADHSPALELSSLLHFSMVKKKGTVTKPTCQPWLNFYKMVYFSLKTVWSCNHLHCPDSLQGFVSPNLCDYFAEYIFIIQ